MKKLWDLVKSGVDLVKGLISGTGAAAQNTVAGSIEAVGGRKVWVGILTMVYVPLCWALLKMPSELILASLAPFTGFVVVEGIRDIKKS